MDRKSVAMFDSIQIIYVMVVPNYGEYLIINTDLQTGPGEQQ